jgi:hypothetical protein
MADRKLVKVLGTAFLRMSHRYDVTLDGTAIDLEQLARQG